MLLTLLFLVMPLVFTTVIFGGSDDGGTVSVNGQVVTGEERERAIAEINASLRLAMLPFMVIGVWSLRRVLPKSPIDHFEFGPEGLAARGNFGLTRFTWEEIAEVDVRVLPASRLPFAWLTVRLATGRLRRIYFTGYIQIKLFADLGEQTGAIEDWFSQLKHAYTKGNSNGSIPLQPKSLIGKMIHLDGTTPERKADPSVIERQS